MLISRIWRHAGNRSAYRGVLGGPPDRRTATWQVCDLHLWCAVRDSNPEPADYSQSRLTLTTMGRS